MIIKLFSALVTTRGRRLLWKRSGDQGQAWVKAEVSVQGDKTDKVGLEFEGVIGTSFNSDIAIDDVRIQAGPCDSPGEIYCRLCLWHWLCQMFSVKQISVQCLGTITIKLDDLDEILTIRYHFEERNLCLVLLRKTLNLNIF